MELSRTRQALLYAGEGISDLETLNTLSDGARFARRVPGVLDDYKHVRRVMNDEVDRADHAVAKWWTIVVTDPEATTLDHYRNSRRAPE